MSRLSEMKLAIERSDGQVALVTYDELLGRARAMQAQHTRRLIGTFFEAVGLVALLRSIKRSIVYRRTLSELRRLDDKALRDIGLKRLDLRMAALKSCEKAVPAQPFWGRHLVQSLRRLAVERETLQQLSSLDDRMLNDIGFERGQLRDVSHRMASQGILHRMNQPVADAIHRAIRPLRLAVQGFTQPLSRAIAKRVAANQDRPAPAKAA